MVHIQGEDVLFAVVVLQLQGGKNLQDLPGDGHVVILGHVFDELLGDGGAALDISAGEHAQEARGGAPPVHPLVVPEALVLNGHEGVDEVLRDILILYQLRVFLAD